MSYGQNKIPRSIRIELARERWRQDEKFGDSTHLSDERWLAILAEEFGEVAHDVMNQHWPNLEKELIQVAAVTIAWLEAIDKRRRVPKEKP